jgi:hypothetical protein
MPFDIQLRDNGINSFDISLSTSVASGGILKRYNGSTFVQTCMKVRIGASWENKPLKIYKEGSWQTVTKNNCKLNFIYL